VLEKSRIIVLFLECTNGAFQERFDISPSFLPSGFCNIGVNMADQQNHLQRVNTRRMSLLNNQLFAFIDRFVHFLLSKLEDVGHCMMRQERVFMLQGSQEFCL
jgi:hypothetical protein